MYYTTKISMRLSSVLNKTTMDFQKDIYGDETVMIGRWAAALNLLGYCFTGMLGLIFVSGIGSSFAPTEQLRLIILFSGFNIAGMIFAIGLGIGVKFIFINKRFKKWTKTQPPFDERYSKLENLYDIDYIITGLLGFLIPAIVNYNYYMAFFG